MAGLKEIKRRLRSVHNTKKITYAMKLVSAAKLKRVQEAVTSFRMYRQELDRVLNQIVAGQVGLVFQHPLMAEPKQANKICLLVVGGQRGLCGGYNSNVNKKVDAFIREKSEQNPDFSLEAFLIGKKVADYFRRVKHQYGKSYEDLPENINLWPLEELSIDLQTGFLSGKYDEVWVVYTRFKSVISQTTVCERLLPLEVGAGVDEPGYITEAITTAETVFEPSKEALFNAILPRVVNARVRQACIDAKASETGSRMTAMDAATRNATQLVRKLELKHNKLRQNRITSELLDIVGGAEAIK